MNRACAGQTVLDLFPAPPRDHVEDTLEWMCDVHGCIRGEIEGEVRKNDRGYEVGDKIVFDVVTNKSYFVGEAARHPLNGATYRIDYILDDFEGLAQKYVAMAISKEGE